ncbi:MAG: transporter substrate-binding domain-containing protein [Proteobacteria bacterium]|nr:transporter substrate-binding domain-containing protein [Pseudomonadota bacterium]
MLKWLDSGKADFIHDTGYTKDRDKYLDYSDPIIEMSEVIFVRSDRYDITGFDSLKNKKVDSIRKHITHLYLQQFPEINCIVAETPMQGIIDLISRKTDAFVYT